MMKSLENTLSCVFYLNYIPLVVVDSAVALSHAVTLDLRRRCASLLALNIVGVQKYPYQTGAWPPRVQTSVSC
jgi:hypothetical protein